MKTSICLTALFLSLVALEGAPLKSVDDFKEAAEKANVVLTVPEFPGDVEGVSALAPAAIAKANKALDAIGQLEPKAVTFANTVRALDDLGWEAFLAANKLSVIKNAHPQKEMRDTAEEGIKKFQEWAVGTDYREDVYKTMKAFVATNPKLEGEDAKLLAETMRDYRRAGLDLAPEKRKEVEQLRKDVARLETDFQSNIVAVKAPITFTKAEVEGVPQDLLDMPGVKQGDDGFTLLANVTFQYQTFMENAKQEAARRKMHLARMNLAREKNVPLLNQILGLRNEIALKLGYKSWADFQTEIKMAKTGATARQFIADMVKGTQPKFDAELAEMRKLKAAETGEANAKINRWDWRYYTQQINKTRYAVDKQALRVFFPYQPVLDGMFEVYQSIFDLKFDQIDPGKKWTDDLQLWVVSDASSGAPLGMFYLDMFPRDGKYNHFAQFDIISGKLLPNGKYQRPTVGLICNFPPPTGDTPSLLTHGDVETLFHEFGHALHSIVTTAKYARFSGSNVPRDFVEAPSQMLQNWVWEKKVLDTFAADYRDPSKKIPTETIAKMKEAKIGTVGTTYRRQFAMADLDLALHDVHPAGQAYDAVKVSNDILEKVFLPIEPETAFVAYFGHLAGYDAGYYGYAWADAIAADMATVFEKAPKGYFDKEAGMKLRNEIYAVGSSRDVNVSIQKFLGRERSIDPFLATLGLGKEEKALGGPTKENK